MTDQVDATPSEAPVEAPETIQEAPQEVSFLDSFSDEEIKSYVEKAGYKDINGIAKSAMQHGRDKKTLTKQHSFRGVIKPLFEHIEAEAKKGGAA